MRQTTAGVLELLVRHNPISVDELAGVAVSPKAVALRDRITAQPAPAPLPARRRVTRRHLLAIAVAAAMVATATVVPTTLLPDSRLGPSPAAAETLERLAAVAGSQPAGWQDRYLYTKVQTLDAGTNTGVPYTVLFPAVRETWLAPDGSGRTRERHAPPIFFSERDRRLWKQEGGRLAPRTSDHRFGPRADYAADASVPTDVDELEAALRARAESENPPPEDGYTIEGEMLKQISDLLYGPASSPALRAALYRVMARTEGVELVGERTDPLGRTGIAFSRPGGYGDADHSKVLLIIDPKTAEPLAEQEILVAPVEWIDANSPVVIGQVTFLDAGWSDSLDQRPAD